MIGSDKLNDMPMFDRWTQAKLDYLKNHMFLGKNYVHLYFKSFSATKGFFAHALTLVCSIVSTCNTQIRSTLSWRNVNILSNSYDPDVTSNYSASHLGPSCLHMALYIVRSRIAKVRISETFFPINCFLSTICVPYQAKLLILDKLWCLVLNPACILVVSVYHSTRYRVLLCIMKKY